MTLKPVNYYETFISSIDTKICLSIYKQDKNKPVVVFLPGTMVSPLFYDEFLLKIAENGFNVVGVHFVSHGKSPKDKKVFSFEDMKQNVKDAITYVLTNFNNQTILMGSSQGGILAIAVAGEDNRIKAVFPHNILLPSLPESIEITRFPHILKYSYKSVVNFIKWNGKIFPGLQLPMTFYLSLNRVTESRKIKEDIYKDDSILKTYPLYFLSSLFGADITKITDGSIKCPVVVIASIKDPLFSFSYTKKVYELIKAPEKEMVVFDEPYHLIFNECIENILDPIVEKLKEVKFD